MIQRGNIKPALLMVGGVALALLNKGATRIWEAVSSCFGSGFWRSEKPWKDSDGWR